MPHENPVHRLSDEITADEKLGAMEGVSSGAEEVDLEQLEDSQRGKKGATKSSEKARRAIEEHLDRTKLHKELDYLFDEGFEEGE